MYEYILNDRQFYSDAIQQFVGKWPWYEQDNARQVVHFMTVEDGKEAPDAKQNILQV